MKFKRILFAFLIITLFVLFFYCPAIFAQEVGFSKGNPSAKDIVIKTLNLSKKSIHLAAYQFTSKDIIKKLVEKHKEGVNVHVILDRTQKSGEGTSIMNLEGIDCRIDTKHRIMHHKFIIVDGQYVENGSFNYSENADKNNAENTLLTNSQLLYNSYLKEWNRIYETGIPCENLYQRQ